MRTTTGATRKVRISATGPAFVTWSSFLSYEEPGLAHPPVPLYRRQPGQAQWMRVLTARHAVYLKYNQCRDGPGFPRLAARALALLRRHRDYRLIVDLRDNGGGDTTPFQSLLSGISADRGLAGRVIGLVNQDTDSSATLDAQALQQAGGVLIGQAPADPIDRWGNEKTFRLPGTGVVVQYTSATVNPGGRALATPDLIVRPTLAQIVAGDDPGLAAALSYRAGRGRANRP